MTPTGHAKKPSSDSRDTTPKAASYTLTGHPAPSTTIPEHVRDHLQTLGVGDTIDLELTSDQVDALKAQGVLA